MKLTNQIFTNYFLLPFKWLSVLVPNDLAVGQNNPPRQVSWITQYAVPRATRTIYCPGGHIGKCMLLNVWKRFGDPKFSDLFYVPRLTDRTNLVEASWWLKFLLKIFVGLDEVICLAHMGNPCYQCCWLGDHFTTALVSLRGEAV